MRASVDSMASTVRPFTFSLARSSSSSVTPSSAVRRSSVADHVHRLAHVVRPRAHVDADLPGVHVLARVRVDRVGQAALLAHLLEQPRRVEPPRIVSSTRSAKRRSSPRASPGRRGTGGTARCPWRGSARSARGSRAEPARARRRRDRPSRRSAWATTCVVLHVARRGQHDVRAPVALVVVGGDVGNGHRADHVGGADDRAAQRMVAEDRVRPARRAPCPTARPRTWRSPRSPPGARSRRRGRRAPASCPRSPRARARSGGPGSGRRPRWSPCPCRRSPRRPSRRRSRRSPRRRSARCP